MYRRVLAEEKLLLKRKIFSGCFKCFTLSSYKFSESGVKTDFQQSRNLCRISFFPKEMILFFVKFEEREQYENYKEL